MSEILTHRYLSDYFYRTSMRYGDKTFGEVDYTWVEKLDLKCGDILLVSVTHSRYLRITPM